MESGVQRLEVEMRDPQAKVELMTEKPRTTKTWCWTKKTTWNWPYPAMSETTWNWMGTVVTED